MATKKSTQVDVLALLEQLGVTPDAVRDALGVNQAATRKTITVTVLDGEDAVKFGDVAVSKTTSNGRSIPKLGVFAADLPGLIADLTAAQEAISAS